MRDPNGTVLYVGKAKNLKKRVSSYFHKQGLGKKTSALVEKIHDIKVIVTDTEDQALLLECELIKKESPRYNILLRDDKSYPFIFVSTQHAFPRLIFYRGKRRQDGALFGPFPSVAAVKETLAFLQKVFKLRTCRDSYFKNRSRPCLEYQIHRCRAPCVAFIDKKTYEQDVSLALDFLNGQSQYVIDLLENKMKEASTERAYEQAATIRDQIQQLRLIQKSQTLCSDDVCADVLGLVIENNIACVVMLVIRQGQLLRTQAFFPKLPANFLESTTEQVMHAFLMQHYLYQADSIPAQIIVPEIKDKKIEIVLSTQRGKQCSIITQARGVKAKWLSLARNNAAIVLKTRLASKASMTSRFTALANELQLTTSINRMECFDISHTGGDDTVGSCVVFDTEGPLKKEYRQFNIKGIKKSDDYAAMEQVVGRRYKRLLKENKPLPDIVFIDGGKGQVAKAKQAIESLGLHELFIVGVSKGPSRKAGLETILLEKEGISIQLETDSPALHLIQHIRDEAHRFAVLSHRHKREKKTTSSVLQDIEGIGPKRRRALLHYFGGIKQLTEASVDAIQQVPGISKEAAEKIVIHLKSFKS